MSQPTPPRREDSSQKEARDRILEIAGRLLDEGGYEGLTIRKLASDSGYTPPAIYALFGDKAALVDALVERAFADLLERLRKLENPEDPRDYARRALREVVRFGREHHWHFRLLEERGAQAENSETVDETREILRGPLLAIARAEGLQEADVGLLRQAFWALLHGLIALPPARPDIDWHPDLAEITVDALLEGMLGPSGRVKGDR